MHAHTPQGEDELLGFFLGEWLTLQGRTGALLFRGDGFYGEEPYLLGNSDGRSRRVLLADTSTHNATAYELQTDGSWAQVGQVKWARLEEELVQLETDQVAGLRQLSPLVVLSSMRQRGLLRAVDVHTGRTVWNASYAILTGAWVTEDGFTDSGVLLSIHPLNSSWALASAFASNRTGFVIVQTALLDLTTGRVVATSPTTPPMNASVEFDDEQRLQWFAASGRLLTCIDFPQNSDLPSVFLAYDATTLREVSHGLLPESAREQGLRVQAVDEAGVSVVIDSASKPRLVGQRLPAVHIAREEMRDHSHANTAGALERTSNAR